MRKLAILLTMLCAVVGLGLYATSSGFSSPWAPTRAATPTAGEDAASSTAFVPLPDRWYRLATVAVEGNARVGRVWEVYRTTGYESFLTDEQRANCKAAEGTNRLITNSPQAKPNDWQLFKFIKGSGANEGKYAILSKATGKYLSDDGKNSGSQPIARFDFKSDKPIYGFYLKDNAITADGKYQSRVYLTDPAVGEPRKFLNCAAAGQGFAVNYYTQEDGSKAELFTFTEVIEETFSYATAEKETMDHNMWESIKFGIRPIQVTMTGTNFIDYYSDDRALAVRANGTVTISPEDGYYISKLTLGVTKGKDLSASTIKIADAAAQNVTAEFARANAVTVEYVNLDPEKEITITAGSQLVTLWVTKVQLTKKPGAETITFPLALATIDHNTETFAPGTTWYRMYIRNDKNKYVRYDGGEFSYVGENPDGGVIAGDLWCMEPTENGIRFYNYATGADKIISGTTTAMAMEPIFDSTNDKWAEWIVYAGNTTSDTDPYYYVRARFGTGNSNLYWNDNGRTYFGYWNSSSAANDGGSQLRFIEYAGEMPELPEVDYSVDVDEDALYTNTEDKYTTSVSLKSSVETEPQTINNLQSETEKKVVWNFADGENTRVLKASPGDEVTFAINSGNVNVNAQHKIVYIDWDKDGFDGTAHTSFVGYSVNDTRKATGDMVAGTHTNRGDNIPVYTIPDNIPLGKYRIRFKVDWDGNGASGANANSVSNPSNPRGNENITVKGIIVDAILEIVEPATDEFEPDPDKWYRLTVIGSDNRRGRSLEAYHVDIEPAPVAAANAAAGRLLTNAPIAAFNDYQLFHFEKDETTGRYAIYNKGVRAYLNTSDLTGNAATTRFDFSSSIPVYGFYISGSQTCLDGQPAAEIHLTNPTGSDHKFLSCAPVAQGFAVNFTSDASDASHKFVFTEMEDNRVAVISHTSSFLNNATFDVPSGYGSKVTTHVTSDAPVSVSLTANNSVGYSSKNGDRVVQLHENAEIALESVNPPEGYFISKVTLNVSSANNNASSVSINGNEPVAVAGGSSSGNTTVAVTAASPDQAWKITVGPNSILIWEITVEFSRPFSADVRKAQTAERLRKLGNLTVLGFDSSEAERRAKAVEAHDFAPEASAEEIIDWCAAQFIDYVKTADYGDDNAYFHINNNSYTGSLAVDRSGVADLYDAMSVYALWSLYPGANDGTIKLYNPQSGKWLAVEGPSVTIVDSEADATPLYIGGSAGKNIAVFTTSAADINNAVVASSATTLGMAAATTNLRGPDHWALSSLTDADCKEVLDVSRDIVLGDLDVYEKVPALWSPESLAEVRKEVDQVTQPDDVTLATLFNEGQGWAAYNAQLEEVMAGIKERCVGISFYLTQKTKSDAAPLRIISVNTANTVVRVAALDNSCIFNIDQVNTEGLVKISYTNADGVKKYLARSGNAYVANDAGSWFEIVVSPRNTDGAYSTNEVALLDAQGGFINRNGVDGFGMQSYGYDDDGSRWIVTAMNAAQAAADIETYRELAIAKLEQLREVPFFWTAENMNAAIEEVKAVSVSTAGLSPSSAIEAVLAAQDKFDKIIIAARATIEGIKFAAFNDGHGGNKPGYLSSRQDGISGDGYYLTQQSTITGPTAQWELTVVDATVPTFTISGPAVEKDEICYIKARPGVNDQSWQLTKNLQEAGEFKVITVGATGKVAFISYPNSGDETDYATIHSANSTNSNRLVRWLPSAESSQWTIMGLEAAALQEQLDLDKAAAENQLEQMRRIPAIWPSELIDDAESKMNDFTITEDNPLNQYIAYVAQIDKIISDVNGKVENTTVYFTNVSNQGIMTVGDAHGNNTNQLYRQNDKVLTNGNFFKLIPDGTGFKLFNEYYGRYIAGNPGRDNAQWQTVASEADAATLYFDAAFCSSINQTGISSSSTSGASGNYFIHANAGHPVRWNGNNDPSRWIVAAATQSDIDAAKYIGWLEEAKSASPWGAYSLSEGIKALKSAVAAGNVTAEQIEGLYNSTVETVEQTIASSAQDVEVIISHHPTGHILVASDTELHKRADDRTVASLSNNTFDPAWRWKLVAKEDTPDKFHIMSMATSDDAVSYVSSFRKPAGAGENVMGTMTTTEDEKLAAVISLREGRLVFENGDEEPVLQTLAEGDDEAAAEPDHEYWVIGLYQPNTLLPRTSTPDAPKLYYIRNVAKMRETEANKQRQYLTAGGSANGSDLRLYQTPQPASLWYVTDEGEGTYKIHNAYYPEVMIQSPNKVTTDPLDGATSLYIKECTHITDAKGVGLYISKSSDISKITNDCLDRGGFNSNKDATYDGLSGGYSPRGNDYLGTAWIFTPVNENDEVAYFEQAKETSYNAAMDMIEYFRMANPWCWDVFDRAAGDVGATFSPSGSFGDALRELDEANALNYMKTDFGNALTDEISGKTFIINSVARRENIPNVPTARIGVNTTGVVAVKNGVTDQNDAFTFMPSEKDGYFYIYNGEGKFIGASGSSRFMVDNIDDAGRFTLEIRFTKSGSNLSNYWTCIKQDNGQYLKVDADGAGLMGNAANNNSNITGFEFEIYHPASSGIEDVTTDSDAFKPVLNGKAQLYDLRGARINPTNAAPGIYILRTGTEAVKIRIR